MPAPSRTVLIGGLLFSLLIAPAHAAQYVTTIWQTEQGMPQSSVNAMLQDHRGYLWIGTFGGLARFDGERFTAFDAVNTPGFGDARMILSLYESRSGVLWIGTVLGGLIRLDGGVATTYTERDGLPSRFVRSIRGDAEGNVWVNTSRGIARFSGTRLAAYTSHRGKAVTEFFLQARDGSMWFRSGRDVVRFGADGSVATVTVRKPNTFLVGEARGGSIWIAFRDENRVVRYSQGTFSDVPMPPIGRRVLMGEYPVYAVAMAKAENGELLLLTPAGLVRIEDRKLSPPEPLNLPANNHELPKVRSLLEDREGNLWLGTIGMGLVRLRRAPLTAYAKDEGLSDSSFNTVFQDRQGRMWLGGDLLYYFDGSGFHAVPGVVDIRSIAQTRDGDLWFGGYGGMYRWRSGVLTYFKVLEAPAVGAIHEDREGTLWIGGIVEERSGGLYRFRDGRLEQIPGISDVESIFEDRDGGLWVGSVEELLHMHAGKTVKYDQRQGLPDHIVDIHQDANGTIWVASYGGGLARLHDGRFQTITTKAGLPNNMLHGIVNDGRGNFWVSSNQNIFRLSLKELNDFADGRVASVSPDSYGTAEGMRSGECDGGSPSGWKSRDGRIWFPTLRGMVAIDPMAGNRLPPPVVIEEAVAKKLMLARDGQTSVPPGNETLDFRFTALSFAAPGKLRFKYRLEPFDKDWVDAGTRRTAHYTNMTPGKYRFQVIAANNYGIWNNEGASVRFELLPHFYQRNWFYALCATAFLALLWLGYQFRVRRLQREFKQIRDVIETIPAMAWTARPDGSNEFVNRRWAEYTGLSAEETAGAGWTAALHPEDRQRHSEEWRGALETGEPLESEVRFRCSANGEYRWFLARGVPLRDGHGNILRWYGTLTDIEDLKRAEQERERLREFEAEMAHFNRVSMMGELAVSVAHEVNQPLTGIVSNGSACIRLLAGQSPNVEEALEGLRDIVRDGKRAGEVIARIRAMTKRAAMPRERLDLNEVIREVLVLVGDEAKKSSVVIRRQFAEGLCPVSADRVQLQQVVLNLVMNAIEAMSGVTGRQRELVIDTRNIDDGQVRVTVEDSGVGLDPTVMSKMFEPFYTTKSSGMGMGLSICRSIVQSHGGRLWATANDGPGTRFHFALPQYHGEERNARVRSI